MKTLQLILNDEGKIAVYNDSILIDYPSNIMTTDLLTLPMQEYNVVDETTNKVNKIVNTIFLTKYNINTPILPSLKWIDIDKIQTIDMSEYDKYYLSTITQLLTRYINRMRQIGSKK